MKDSNTHLGMLLQDLGPAPPEVPRKDNRAICLPLYSKWETRLDDLSAALDITPAEVLFMEAKSTFVLIMRSLPTDSHAVERPLRLDQVARAAATTRNDAIMVRKGIRGIELLSQLQDMNVLTKKDGFSALREEVEQELIHLGSAKDTAIKDLAKLQEVFRSIREHNAYLNQQLDTYKDYLKNVRDQAAGRNEESKKDKKGGKPKAESSVKYTQPQLEKDGIVVRSSIPPDRRINVFFLFISTTPGAFIINLFYKGEKTQWTNILVHKLIMTGRANSLLELDLKLDDLLEMQKNNQEELNLTYVTFSVSKLLALLNKKFAKKKGW